MNLREAEELYAKCIELNEPARSAALDLLAKMLRRALWSAHWRPVAHDLARQCDARMDPRADLLKGMGDLARLGLLAECVG